MSIMLNEFLSAPDVVRNVIAANKAVYRAIAKEFKERGITNITTVARGTSDNAATYFKYIVEAIGEIMVSKFTPSITTVYGAKVNLSKNMVLAISQSGMSTDTLMVVQSAKETGAMTVAVPYRSCGGRGTQRRRDEVIPCRSYRYVYALQRALARHRKNERGGTRAPARRLYRRV